MKKAMKSPNPVDVWVGARIRSARLIVAMSQTTLANTLGVTFQQVQKYEKGRNRVSSSRLKAIANALGREVAWFFEGSPESTDLRRDTATDDPCHRLGITEEGLALARAYNAITDIRMRQAILQMAEAAASNRKQI